MGNINRRLAVTREPHRQKNNMRNQRYASATVTRSPRWSLPSIFRNPPVILPGLIARLRCTPEPVCRGGC
jgi:hypothetical protein